MLARPSHIGVRHMKHADLIIAGGTILPMTVSSESIIDGAIAITADRICDIGDRTTLLNTWSASEIIDATGCVVMPGLINGHTHAAMTCFRGLADDLGLEDWLHHYIFPAEARHVTCEFVYWGTLLACIEMMRSGTTTFCDMYFFEDAAAQAATTAGMRCLLGGVLIDFPSPNTKTPAEGLAYTQSLIEKWNNHDLVNLVIQPHSLYTCSPDLLMKGKKLADTYNLPMGVHYLETAAEFALLHTKFKEGPTAFLKERGFLSERFIAFHGVHMTPRDIEIFAASGASVIHNPESNMKLASGVAPVPAMLNAGMNVGIGTDGCASNNNLDMLQEIDTTAKLHKVQLRDPTVMKAHTVLDMATRMGAHALCLNGVTGELRVGLKADLIMIDFNKPHLTPVYNAFSHIVYAAQGSDVDTVIINGRVVMRNRRLLTVDEYEVMAKVNELAEKIKKSLNLGIVKHEQ